MKTLSRLTARSAAVLITALALTSCSTHTPAAQDARLRKASGVASVTLIMPAGLWKDTKPRFAPSLDGVKPSPADGDRGARGLVRITLSGTQVIDYMKDLDSTAHPSAFHRTMGDLNVQAAGRVYDAIGAALDTIRPVTSSTDPAPEVLIDDTLATAAP
ncbi:hypothetical protein [Kitasatospora griseola]